MANKKTKTSKKLNLKALRLFYVTTPDTATAERISVALLKEGLVACSNILPGMSSFYRWKGKIENSKEVVLILKSQAQFKKALFERISSLHPYETPCILEVKIEDAALKYGDWLLHAHLNQ